MSFGVYFQRFNAGEAGVGGNAEALGVLGPYLVRDRNGGVLGLSVEDGSAELYGLDGPDGFMATHISGRTSWDLLVRAARAARFAIMPVGCPVCVPSPEIAGHLPAELAREVGSRLVMTGDELLAVIRET